MLNEIEPAPTLPFPVNEFQRGARKILNSLQMPEAQESLLVSEATFLIFGSDEAMALCESVRFHARRPPAEWLFSEEGNKAFEAVRSEVETCAREGRRLELTFAVLNTFLVEKGYFLTEEAARAVGNGMKKKWSRWNEYLQQQEEVKG